MSFHAEQHLLRPGNTNCGGCGMSIGLSMFGRVLEKEQQQAVMVIPACCGIVTAGAFPTSGYQAPVIASTFAAAPAFASGVAAVHKMSGDPTHVVCWAGDGGTYDIGLGSLSAAAERNENLIYICYDNEIYGNTGGQRSSATPPGARTTTTASGKKEPKKDIMAILAAHRIPYAATLSVAHPEDFARKLRFALKVRGLRFLVMLSPCPTGWKSESEQSVELVRRAVRSGLFPLYEIFDGVRYRVNRAPDGLDVAEYFSGQRRFGLEGLDMDAARSTIAQETLRLSQLAELWPATEADGAV